MSLINDVLRQLDSKPSSNAGMHSILPSALITENNEQSKTRFVIAAAGILLLLVYISQLMLGRPLFSSPAIAAKTVTPEVLTTNIVPLKVTNLNIISDKESALLDDISLPAKDKVVIDNKTETSIVEDNEAAAINKSSLVPSTNQLSEPVVISIQEERWEEIEYQTALRHFIGGNIAESDRIIKRVLKSSITNEYLGLQARIYIKQEDASAFYELVKQHPDNNDIDWYKLVAPGLQLFSYYHLSNQYYYSLIKVEPGEIRWQLAIALNHIRLDKEDKALAIYNKLYQSKQTSNRQKQWLGNKIKRLSLNKA
jgi:hypothetical protein